MKEMEHYLVQIQNASQVLQIEINRLKEENAAVRNILTVQMTMNEKILKSLDEVRTSLGLPGL